MAEEEPAPFALRLASSLPLLSYFPMTEITQRLSTALAATVSSGTWAKAPVPSLPPKRS